MKPKESAPSDQHTDGLGVLNPEITTLVNPKFGFWASAVLAIFSTLWLGEHPPFMALLSLAIFVASVFHFSKRYPPGARWLAKLINFQCQISTKISTQHAPKASIAAGILAFIGLGTSYQAGLGALGILTLIASFLIALKANQLVHLKPQPEPKEFTRSQNWSFSGIAVTGICLIIAAFSAGEDETSSQTREIARKATINAGTATIELNLQEVDAIYRGSNGLGGISERLLQDARPVVRAIFNLARNHPELTQIVINIQCERSSKRTPIKISQEQLNAIRKFPNYESYTRGSVIEQFAAEELGPRLTGQL